MRFLAAILVTVVLLAGGFFGFCYWGAQMEIESIATSVVPAVEALGTYNEVVRQLADETFAGAKFRLDSFIMPDGYAFLTLNVRMKNRGLLPQDWIRIEIAPNAADIAQLFNEKAPTIPGMGGGELTATVLTRAGAETARSFTVTYYVLGTPFSVHYQK